MKRILLITAIVMTITACGRLDAIPYAPATTPETWLQMQPYAEIGPGSQTIIFVQPTTSVIVYLLGLITVAVGVYILKNKDGQRSRYWWGIALLLWGVGALLAGTSYEAFSYVIKCAGRTDCLWTSWWEVIYLLLSVWSIDAMAVAVAYSSTTGRLRKALVLYAVFNAALYLMVVLAGAFIPVKFLISFELLLIVAAPGIVAFFVIHSWRYVKQKSSLDLVYLGTWVWLGITILAYFLYLLSGNTASLWSRGMWFSENDVLHIGLIVWMLYIARVLTPRLKDISGTP